MARNPININPCVWKDYLSTQVANLPHLDDVEIVTNNVIRIMGGNPGAMQLQGTNTYLVGTSKSRILIDTGQGMPIWAENITALLRSHDLDISHVLLTHWHGDHTEGVPDLIAYSPSLASRIYKNQPDRGQHDIVDGQIFRTEGATIRALFTPGHSIDHMCFILEEENALFTGDNVLGHGYSVEEDLGSYMASLVYMAEQTCAVGYPAHGVKIENLPRKMKEYIRHKKTREKQIYDALVGKKARLVQSGQSGKGSLSTRELVSEVHGKMPDEIFELALEPFTVEVLRKLAEERKVGFEVDRGIKRWFLNERTWAKEQMAH
ncbi:hypothetical protein MMC17_006106 [Xylographa soralifera]|nr:hypothetical protein [Xylographa soralifera]